MRGLAAAISAPTRFVSAMLEGRQDARRGSHRKSCAASPASPGALFIARDKDDPRALLRELFGGHRANARCRACHHDGLAVHWGLLCRDPRFRAYAGEGVALYRLRSAARFSVSASAPPPAGARSGVRANRSLSAIRPLAHLFGRASPVSVEAHGEADALSRIDFENLHLHDVAGLGRLARILDESAAHRRNMHEPVLVHADIDEAPKAATLVTTPSRIMPRRRSEICSTPSS